VGIALTQLIGTVGQFGQVATGGLLDEVIEHLVNNVFKIGEKRPTASLDGSRSNLQLSQTIASRSSRSTR
jgi:hypothetical protein